MAFKVEASVPTSILRFNLPISHSTKMSAPYLVTGVATQGIPISYLCHKRPCSFCRRCVSSPRDSRVTKRASRAIYPFHSCLGGYSEAGLPTYSCPIRTNRLVYFLFPPWAFFDPWRNSWYPWNALCSLAVRVYLYATRSLIL